MKDKMKVIKELASSLNKLELESIIYENKDFKVELNTIRQTPVSTMVQSQVIDTSITSAPILTQPVNTGNMVKTEEIKGLKIESPMVGTFYESSSPESDPFVKEGDKVVEGQTLCIIEAMKLMNEIKAPTSGLVRKILAKNGEQVKKSEVLFIIE